MLKNDQLLSRCHERLTHNFGHVWLSLCDRAYIPSSKSRIKRARVVPTGPLVSQSH